MLSQNKDHCPESVMVPKVTFLSNFYSVEDVEDLTSFEFGVRSHLANCRLVFYPPEPIIMGKHHPYFI